MDKTPLEEAERHLEIMANRMYTKKPPVKREMAFSIGFTLASIKRYLDQYKK